jgi:SAM-dependent methyltransferase
VVILEWAPCRVNQEDKAERPWKDLEMSKLGKILKTGVVAGVCGVGLCALARKLKLPELVSDLAQSVEAVPFPGTRLYSFLAGRQLRPLYAAIADQIAGADGFERVLDLGTGAGYLPIEVALRNPETVICGVDRSLDMVRIAHANARVSGCGGAVSFEVGDTSSLPYPGRYFDLVVSVNVLHHWKDPLAVFEEVYHVLAPGGQFWIYDYVKHVPQKTWDALLEKLSPMLRWALQFGPIASSRAAYSEGDFLKLARKTNFVDASVEKLTLPLFGHDMPVFMRAVLHKPALHAEDEARSSKVLRVAP